MRWGDGASPVVSRLGREGEIARERFGSGSSSVRNRLGSEGSPIQEERPSKIG